MNILVVPSIRENSIRSFLKAWENNSDWDEIIIVEDNETRTFDIESVGVGVKNHYSWKEIEETLGSNAWIISKKDSAIRSFGFLMAYLKGADFIFSLDDDCYPVQPNFCQQHIKNMNTTAKWTESVIGMRTRGLPYKNLGKLDNIVLNMGLWEGVPDLDSIQSLSFPPVNDFKPDQPNRIMPVGQYFPLCGMNFGFKRQIAVLSYFAPMGMNSPYHRFDDIWFGIILKKICDHCNFLISCGEPNICHIRASDPFVNLKKEAPGIFANEEFWEVIDNMTFAYLEPKLCLLQVSDFLKENSDPYLQKYGEALKIWASLF
jgi:hypothetical protein